VNRTFSKYEARLIRQALLSHDGTTIAPFFSPEKQKELTAALDKMRSILCDIGGLEPAFNSITENNFCYNGKNK
jgi:hypothetical protein